MKKPISAAAKAAAKVGGKGKPAKAAKGKPAKAKKPEAEKSTIEQGIVVTFVGYKEASDNPYFEAGEDVYVGAIVESEDGTKIVHGVKVADVEAYNADPESVEVEELALDEVKRKRGRAKSLVPKEVAPPPEVLHVLEFDKYVDEADPLASALKLVDDAAKSTFYLGGALALLKHKKKFSTQYGYEDSTEGWRKFLDEKLGFADGKARHLIDIYMSFSSLDAKGIDMKEVAKRVGEIGWAKAAEAAKYVNNDNYEQILDEAETMTLNELKTHVKETYVKEGGTTTGGRQVSQRIKKVTFTFALLEDAAEGVQLILKSAAKQLGMAEDSPELFEHILSEWANEHLDQAVVNKANAATEKKRKSLEKAGVKLPAKKQAIDA